jgi:hypothetical protein
MFLSLSKNRSAFSLRSSADAPTLKSKPLTSRCSLSSSGGAIDPLLVVASSPSPTLFG